MSNAKRGLDWTTPVQTGFEVCPKGTRMRDLLLLALRPAGFTVQEAIDKGLVRDTRAAFDIMLNAEILCGYDVRRVGNRRHTTCSYILVGKHRWSGNYHSFREADPTWLNVRNNPLKLRTQ